MEGTSTTTNRTKIVVLAIALIIVIAGLFWAALTLFTPEESKPELVPATSTPKQELPAELPQTGIRLSNVVDLIDLEAIEEIEELPAPSEAPVAQTYTQPAAAPTDPYAARWAEALNALGIREADQAIIIRLTTDRNIIYPRNCDCMRVVEMSLDPATDYRNFQRINGYVLNRHGSWSAAQDFATMTGGRW